MSWILPEGSLTKIIFCIGRIHLPMTYTFGSSIVDGEMFVATITGASNRTKLWRIFLAWFAVGFKGMHWSRRLTWTWLLVPMTNPVWGMFILGWSWGFWCMHKTPPGLIVSTTLSNSEHRHICMPVACQTSMSNRLVTQACHASMDWELAKTAVGAVHLGKKMAQVLTSASKQKQQIWLWNCDFCASIVQSQQSQPIQSWFSQAKCQFHSMQFSHGLTIVLPFQFFLVNWHLFLPDNFVSLRCLISSSQCQAQICKAISSQQQMVVPKNSRNIPVLTTWKLHCKLNHHDMLNECAGLVASLPVSLHDHLIHCNFTRQMMSQNRWTSPSTEASMLQFFASKLAEAISFHSALSKHWTPMGFHQLWDEVWLHLFHAKRLSNCTISFANDHMFIIAALKGPSNQCLFSENWQSDCTICVNWPQNSKAS